MEENTSCRYASTNYQLLTTIITALARTNAYADYNQNIDLFSPCLPAVAGGGAGCNAAFRRDGGAVGALRPGGTVGAACRGLGGAGGGQGQADAGVSGGAFPRADDVGWRGGDHRVAAAVWLRGIEACALCHDGQFLQSGALQRVPGHGAAGVRA